MIYDLSNPIEKENAITRFKFLLDKKDRIELTKKHAQRSRPQNRYIHLLFSYFGLQTGYTLEEVKQEIFKKIVNEHIFFEGKKGKLELESWRSTADLDKSEMTDAINRFLDWSVIETGIRLPQPEDLAYLDEIEKELSKQSNTQYL